MPTRVEVYEAIDGERDYQDRLGPDRTDGHRHTVGDYLVLLDHYVTKAGDAWVSSAGDASALDQIRKIAAIAVHCMEDHGTVKRGVR